MYNKCNNTENNNAITDDGRCSIFDVCLGQGSDSPPARRRMAQRPLCNTPLATLKQAPEYIEGPAGNAAKPKKSLLDSVRHASNGLTLAAGTQKNLRLHILMGILAVVLCFLFKIPAVEAAIVSLSIAFVIVCELVNTAVELSMDFINGYKFHPRVKTIKDISAAAVLIASLNALIVGLIIYSRHIFALIG